jgi:hypothetical protein
MCHSIYFSTTSDEDLTLLPQDLFIIYRAYHEYNTDELSVLRYPQTWHLVCQYGGCSCHFRHVLKYSPELRYFSPVEYWCPEDDDDVESTSAIYDVFVRLVSEGHSVDVLDIWEGDEVTSITSITVSVSEVPRDAFRFFDGVRFELVA